MKRFVLSVVVVMVLLTGCFGGGTKDNGIPSLEIEGLTINDPIEATATAIIKNNGGSGYYHWNRSVWFIAQNERGVPVGNSSAQGRSLYIKAGETVVLDLPPIRVPIPRDSEDILINFKVNFYVEAVVSGVITGETMEYTALLPAFSVEN